MPARKLSHALVERLKVTVRRAAKQHGGRKRVYRAVGRMKNIDPLRERLARPTIISEAGGRVRVFDVSRNFPRRKVVIKRVHSESARQTIRQITETVRAHNKRFGRRERAYVLLKPEAYDIGAGLIAMPKVNAPTVQEMLYDKTPQGLRMLKKLEQKNGISKEEVERAYNRLDHRTEISPGHVWVPGAKDKKLQFLPVLDLA